MAEVHRLEGPARQDSGDPTPLGRFFDELTYRYAFEVSVADRIRVGRLLANAPSLRDLGTLRLALAALVTRDRERHRQFLRCFDRVFGKVATPAEAKVPEPFPPPDFDPGRFLAELRAACGESMDDGEPEAPEGPGDGPAHELSALAPGARFGPGSVHPKVPLMSIRIVRWPEGLPPPGQGEEGTATSRRVEVRIDPDRPEANRLSLAGIGCRDRPMLDADTLNALADAMGYFSNPEETGFIDVGRSIERTVALGFPAVEFQPRREVCRVLLLRELSGDRHEWNTVPEELARGLAARGVPLTLGTFRFSPELFHDEAGRPLRLDDLDGVREALLPMIVGTGAGLCFGAADRVLEDLRLWPRVAWIDPREERFWDAGTQRVLAAGVPVFEASPRGLLSLARTLLSERGQAPVNQRIPAPAREIESVLDDASLPWAAACSMLPRCSPAMAESLRRRFFDAPPRRVPPHAIGQLWHLRGCSWDGEALRFSGELQEALWERGDSILGVTRRLEVSQHLADLFAAEEGRLPEASLARQVCEVLRLTLRLQDPKVTSGEVERLEMLTGPDGPLAGFFRTDARGRGRRRRWIEHRDPLIRNKVARLLGTDEERNEGDAAPILPEDMVPIPGGPFRMGDPTAEGHGDERPMHEVEVSSFAIGRYPVTNGQWEEVRAWGMEHGYDLEKRGEPGREDHPVVNVSWYDAVKWCNARSEKEGRRPVYLLDEGHGTVYRRGEEAVETRWVDWGADGYRLPTEAEWEKAARGGLEGHHYPWESKGKGYERFIDPEKANYEKSGKDGTTPVGQYAPNGYGLYDMAGNVWEWCWDWFDDAWYKRNEAKTSDTCGPENGASRVHRGGSWASHARNLRCSCRDGSRPSVRIGSLGFRPSLGRWGLGRESGESGARRDDERSERRRVSEARAMGCLVVRVPEVEGVRVWGRGPGGERELKAGVGELMEAGQWALRCEAAGYEATRGEVEIRVGEAKEVGMALERGVPEGFVWIPGGEFAMGDPWEEGWEVERPVHRVWVSEVWMDRYAMTNRQWREVRAWAVENGYELEVEGDPAKGEHPLVNVSWYDAVKWCNARSEKEGRRPVYYLDEDHGEVYRKGGKAVKAGWVDWDADGYRLPTEAEWEKAARGGLEGHHYPWESKGKGYEGYIEPGKANYEKSGKVGTTPVGQYARNGYGLYDMAGNVWEWCWDCWDDTWYQRDEAKASDTRGPESGALRVHRGGGWADHAWDLRCSFRFGFHPSIRYGFLGFRPSLGRLGRAEPAEGGGEARRDDEPSRRPTSGGAGKGEPGLGLVQRFKAWIRQGTGTRD